MYSTWFIDDTRLRDILRKPSYFPYMKAVINFTFEYLFPSYFIAKTRMRPVLNNNGSKRSRNSQFYMEIYWLQSVLTFSFFFQFYYFILMLFNRWFFSTVSSCWYFIFHSCCFVYPLLVLALLTIISIACLHCLSTLYD